MLIALESQNKSWNANCSESQISSKNVGCRKGRLPRSKTIDAPAWCGTLRWLRESTRRQETAQLSRGVIFQHDNPTTHGLPRTQGLDTFLKHWPYSPGLVPSDCPLFGLLKQWRSQISLQRAGERLCKKSDGSCYNFYEAEVKASLLSWIMLKKRQFSGIYEIYLKL